jgi:hypothetical protein
MVTNRCGAPRRWAIAVDATASVGETMAPNTNAAAQEKLGRTAWATTATMSVVAITSPMASRLIGRRLKRKSRHDVLHASA